LVAGAFPTSGLPSFNESAIRDGVAALCEGVSTTSGSNSRRTSDPNCIIAM